MELEFQKKEIAKQRDYAEAQRDQIMHQRDEIQSSITYARRIQFAALTPETVMNEMLQEYFVYNRSRDIVSGDFYWAGRGNQNIYFAVADCTGHGVPGAFLSMLGISSLNEIIKTTKDKSAATVLDQLASRIRESLHQDNSSSQESSIDGMDIALCSFNPGTGQLQFAGANNHLYLIRDGEMKVIRADRQDISSRYESPDPFTNHAMDAKDGDLIYLFSDGFPDQFGGEERRKYKYVKFRKLLLDIHHEPMSKQEMLLSMEFNQWKGNNEQIDDVLVMGVKIHLA
jgi:serine phosphatase RsbU (regulator of sigma subunit)